MTVTFYQLSINPIVLNKTLGTGTDKTCVVKDNLDVLNPTFELDFDASILSKNYMYVADLGRYYFITSIEIINHVIIVRGHVDVLKTYNAQIRSGKCTATRSNKKNLTIPDTMVISLPTEKIQYRKISSEITGGTYVLILGGK
jgi:hypothetical protein